MRTEERRIAYLPTTFNRALYSILLIFQRSFVYCSDARGLQVLYVGSEELNLRSAASTADVMVKREHSFERNLNSGHHEKALKGQTCDYFPSPPSEDSYPDSYEENATFPVPSVSSDSRSGSNDHVFIERQHLSAGLRRGDHRAAAAAAAAASVSSVDSKGKVTFKEYTH